MTNDAIHIVKEMMYDNDAFSKWLGIEIVEVEVGKVILRMKIKKQMTNGFGIAHGGIVYSFADSALAFASNSHGPKSVSIETSISHIAPVKTGDILLAETKEEQIGKSLARYIVHIVNNEGRLVALFHGTVFRKEESWI